jgi:RNA polymerase sigma-70 factor (ECF subfamily)
VSAVLQQRSTDATHADTRLRDRLVFGDEGAFVEMYEQYSALVYTVAARITRDVRVAEDVTQEVFLTIWQRPFDFDPARGTLRGWLAMIAHRRAVDVVRREEKHRRTALDVRLPAESGLGDPVGDQVSDVDAARRLGRAVRALPEPLRQAITLAYFQGRTYREVARELGVPEGTAKSRLREGLRRLAVALSGVHAYDSEGT